MLLVVLLPAAMLTAVYHSYGCFFIVCNLISPCVGVWGTATGCAERLRLGGEVSTQILLLATPLLFLALYYSVSVTGLDQLLSACTPNICCGRSFLSLE